MSVEAVWLCHCENPERTGFTPTYLKPNPPTLERCEACGIARPGVGWLRADPRE